MKYFKLYNKNMPWGDYGNILYRGWNSWDKATGEFIIERTAPSVPRIWLDDAMMFSVDDMKKTLERSGLKGLSFQVAIKKRIVFLDWMKWDFSAPDPQLYPAQGEPENYILRRKHNQKLSDEIGELWAIIPSNQGFEIRDKCSGSYSLIAKSLGDADFLVPVTDSFSNFYVSEKARDWLLQNGIDDVYTESKPVPIREISEREMEAIHAKHEEHRLLEEISDRMTDEDWRKYFRFKYEARRLAEQRLEAKTEAAKARRIAKAIDNLLEAKKMYRLDPLDEKLLAKLVQEKQG